MALMAAGTSLMDLWSNDGTLLTLIEDSAESLAAFIECCCVACLCPCPRLVALYPTFNLKMDYWINGVLVAEGLDLGVELRPDYIRGCLSWILGFGGETSPFSWLDYCEGLDGDWAVALWCDNTNVFLSITVRNAADIDCRVGIDGVHNAELTQTPLSITCDEPFEATFSHLFEVYDTPGPISCCASLLIETRIYEAP